MSLTSRWSQYDCLSRILLRSLRANLPVSMYEPEFTDHDLWFLNVQADSYIRNCSESISYLYPEQKKRLLALRSLVPEALKSKLKQNEN